MNEKNLGLLAALLTFAVAMVTIKAGVLNPTGALVFSGAGAGGSLLIAVITLVIALTLFSKYFGLIK